jgi:hypothetical protein
MSRLWKSILCLFFVCCFFCLSLKADDLDLLSRLYLSNKKYAKNIEVHAYLITKDQVVKLFSEENGEVIQKTNKELYGQEVFLLTRVKNNGEYMSFGLLNCKIPNRGDPITIEIMMMPGDGNMKSFHDSVLYLGKGFTSNDKGIPVISCKWKSLYIM